MINTIAPCFTQNVANDISEMINIVKKIFVKRLQILGSVNHPTLFILCQLVLDKGIKESILNLYC